MRNTEHRFMIFLFHDFLQCMLNTFFHVIYRFNSEYFVQMIAFFGSLLPGDHNLFRVDQSDFSFIRDICNLTEYFFCPVQYRTSDMIKCQIPCIRYF